MSEPTDPAQVDLSAPRLASLRQCCSLAAILWLGVFLRGWQATESLWLDELHTSWVVSGKWSEVAGRAAAGNQSPLYFYLTWGVARLWGQHEWTLRLLSLVAGTVLIAATGLLVRSWTGSVLAGLLAAGLVAINRDCIFFAQEARPYALVQLSALVHAGIFLRLLHQPTLRWRAAFVAGAVWLFYLHYTTFLFLLAEAVCLLILLPCRRFKIAYTFPQAVRDALLIALLVVPASAHLLSIARHRDNWARIVQAWPLPSAVQVAGLAYLLLPWMVVGVSRWWGRRMLGRSLLSPAGVCAACWFVVPTLIAWLATLVHIAPLCLGRYLVASLVGAIVFAAICHSVCADRWCRWGLAGFLIAATVVSGGIAAQWYRDGRFIGDRTEDWKAAIPWLDQQLQETPLPVFLCADLLEDLALQQRAGEQLVQYCLFPLNGIYPLQAAYVAPLPTTRNVTFSALQRQLVAQRHGAWLVVRAGPQTTSSIVTSLQQSLRQQGAVANVARQQRFGGVAVIQLSID